MSVTGKVRRLRREQTKEERQLWQYLRAGRFAGFKFRRQHPLGIYSLDFFCPVARLSVELDGIRHGHPEHIRHDAERTQFLAEREILELRFWNHRWRQNREGVLLDIWNALHERIGCTEVVRKAENSRYVPPKPSELT